MSTFLPTTLRLPVLLLLLAAISSHGCMYDDPVERPRTTALETELQGIVNGKEEAGWLAVGALTRRMTGYGYFGSFCSGTLIAPRWVLTAGHCLYGQPGDALYPENTMFYVGPDANPTWYGSLPPEGALYQADAFFIHPNYNSNYTSNDIALMHLAEPVEDIPPVQYSDVKVDSSFVGKKALYVGFGVSNGIKNSGGGIKRSGHMKIYNYDATVYISGYEEAGVCFGDSGGPGLLQFDGTWKVIGVNSSVMSQSADPCTGAAIQTRVDAYADWVEKVMTEQEPDCLVDPEACFCPQACGSDGICNNAYCQTWNCAQVEQCFDDCDHEPMCQAGCYIRAADSALDKIHNIHWCVMQKCDNYNDKDACEQSLCGQYVDECKAVDEGPLACGDVQDCVQGCDWNDPDCFSSCYESGTGPAQDDYDNLWICFEEDCASMPQVTFVQDCGWDNCAMQIEICMPAADCSLLGGDCSAGKACWFSPTAKRDCFVSDGGQEDDPCAMIPLSTRPCADGLQCVQDGGNSTCRRLCLSDSHCDNGEMCTTYAFEALPDYGYCDCLDEDGDGFCLLADCDDTDPKVRPGGGERCYDAIDNNCDGVTDEGCGPTNPGKTEGEQDEGDMERSGCSASETPGSPWLLLLALLALGAVRFRRTA